MVVVLIWIPENNLSKQECCHNLGGSAMILSMMSFGWSWQGRSRIFANDRNCFSCEDGWRTSYV